MLVSITISIIVSKKVSKIVSIIVIVIVSPSLAEDWICGQKDLMLLEIEHSFTFGAKVLIFLFFKIDLSYGFVSLLILLSSIPHLRLH